MRTYKITPVTDKIDDYDQEIELSSAEFNHIVLTLRDTTCVNCQKSGKRLGDLECSEGVSINPEPAREKANEDKKDQDRELSIEQVDVLYDFLAVGEMPEGVTVSEPPSLGHDRAFSVIWFLQEILHIIPDHYEQCDECKSLFDDYSDGSYDEKTGKHFCDGCLNEVTF